MKRTTTSLLALAALAAAGVTTANAQVIFDDQFTSGNRTDVGWYITNTTNGANAPSTLSGNLNWTKSSSAGTDPSVLHKSFTSYDLGSAANGTFLRLNVGVTFNTIPVQNNGFRVGLYSFNGTLTSDVTGANPTALRQSEGYYFAVGQDSTSTQSRLSSFVGNTGGPAGSNSGNSTNIGAGDGFKVNAGDTRFYWLEITKNGANFDVAWLLNTSSNNRTAATTAFSGTGLTPVTTTFDGVAFTIVNTGAADYSIDFVTLEVIPEPATWGLLAAGLTTLVIFRRRRRTA